MLCWRRRLEEHDHLRAEITFGLKNMSAQLKSKYNGLWTLVGLKGLEIVDAYKAELDDHE